MTLYTLYIRNVLLLIKEKKKKCLGTKNGVWCVERKTKSEMSKKHIYTYPKLNQMDGGSRKL